MSRIQSSTGLVTGIPIEETVTQLMQLASQPRNLLESRTKLLQSEQLATDKLSSLLLSLRFEANRLTTSLFQAKTVASSNTDVLTAAIRTGATPAVGSYNLRTLQTAASQQLVSNSFSSVDDLTANGTLSFGFGGFVDTGISLVNLNSGSGIAAGKIRITDRAGGSADIDLRAATTVDEVLRAVNNNDDVEVMLTTLGDRFVLTDTSGGTGNLRVQELSGGTTAASLGLSGINLAADQATGSDVVALYGAMKLSELNDGAGVSLAVGNDLAISLADGTTLQVELGAAATLNDVIGAINTAGAGKITAAIAADGNRLQLTDLTAGGGTFSVANIGSGTAATDLGLTNSAAGNVLSGRRLVAGLRDSLVSSLRGGQGLGTLGTLSVTNRAGISSNVNLAGAETLGEIITRINSQAVGMTAAVNSSRSGIALTDVTGDTASNLVVADGDANNSATALGIATSVAAASVNSGSLSRHLVGRATLLASLNQGKGVNLSDFRVTDSAGKTAAVDMNTLGNEPKTLGDVIDRINALAVDVEARINETGDGILLIDRAAGSGRLTVGEIGSGTAAADLRILGSGVTTTIDGDTVTAIDGTTRSVIDLGNLGDPGANVLLSSINGGKGMTSGAFRVTDSNGQSAVVVLNSSAGSFKTVADVIDAINATNIGIEARINSSKSGILLYDTAGGSGKLNVEEVAGGTTAASLGLTKAVKTTTVDSHQVQAIDGVGTFTQPADASALDSLVTRINSLRAGVTASTIYDGQTYRLSLTVDKTGVGNEIMVDGLAAGLSFSEFSAAQNAAIELGSSSGGTGIVVNSATNTFANVVAGVDLNVVAPSQQVVNVTVTNSSSSLLDSVQDFVDAYNSIRSNLDEVTSFDAEALTTGILFGSQAALRVDSDLSRLATGRFSGLGKFTSLQEIGISVDEEGKLSLDKAKFQKAYDSDAGALTELFTNPTKGIAARFKATVDNLTTNDVSALSSRSLSLIDQIKSNTDRLDSMDTQLAKQKERLYAQFAALETMVADLQQNLSALSSLQLVEPLKIGSRS